MRRAHTLRVQIIARDNTVDSSIIAKTVWTLNASLWMPTSLYVVHRQVNTVFRGLPTIHDPPPAPARHADYFLGTLSQVC